MSASADYNRLIALLLLFSRGIDHRSTNKQQTLYCPTGKGSLHSMTVCEGSLDVVAVAHRTVVQ